MLIAHLVPGYFAAVAADSRRPPEWTRAQRTLVWGVALGSTFAPDLDVIYNGLFSGFFNHSVVWTHSLFLHLTMPLVWLILWRTGRWPYFRTLCAVAAIGGLTHLSMDVFAHGTMLLYPLSYRIFVAPFAVRSLYGGFLAYITDPIFIAEPILISLAVAHWIAHRRWAPRVKWTLLAGLAGGLGLFVTAFLLFNPALQHAIAPFIEG